MTSTPTETEPTHDDVAMKHPALGDVVQVPWFAVESHEARGYERVTDDDSDEAPVEVDTSPVLMRHPDLPDDVVEVPWYAVEGREQAGYKRLDSEQGETPAVEQTQVEQPATLPAPTGARTTRATTSGPARTPGPDDGTSAVTTAD